MARSDSRPAPPEAERSAAEAVENYRGYRLPHLRELEAESIRVIREVVAVFENPVLLYSMGKDSSVLLHLLRKACHPAKPPVPLLHVDSLWEFQTVYAFRDNYTRDELGLDVRVFVNEEGRAAGINPFDHGSRVYTDVMRTQALRQALAHYQFDAALGGGRRDEEKSRAKERIFSFRDSQQRWDPRNQRPEVWQVFNTWKNRGESFRVFPLSNWTELDVWLYIQLEQIPIVPLYFATELPTVVRDRDLIVVDDERMRLEAGEEPVTRRVRFRTLGCYPVTGAVESRAASVEEIILEMLQARTSERAGRAIDHDEAGSMEKKKREGYF